MKDTIRKFALSHGMPCIGFSGVEFNHSFVDLLESRRKSGMLSGFEEPDEKVRTDVSAIMKQAKTIISIALPYVTKEAEDSMCLLPQTAPRLSKSSLGNDYHIVMKNKLDILAKFLYNEYGAASECFCDTGPMSDREVARMAGLGFYGKNSNLITEEYGSFVFLGEIVTELELEPDKPKGDSCGACKLCIEACPAKAIEQPYFVNPHKCLSMISQKKQNLTEAEMKLLEYRVYGCDTCQDICPHNRDRKYSELKEFVPQEWNIRLDAEEILTMSNREFKVTYGKTSSGWRGKGLLQRNLIVAMGNSGINEYLPILESLNNEKLRDCIDYAIKRIKT